jgi:hypothetical protein
MKKYCLRTLIMLFDDCCRCQEHINNQIMAAVGLIAENYSFDIKTASTHAQITHIMG